jgi:hypothetical protein
LRATVSIRRAVGADEKCVKVLDLPLAVLDLPLAVLGLPLAVIHASIEGLDGSEDDVERRFFRGSQRSDVFLPRGAIWLVVGGGWVQGAPAVLLMVHP